jgi:hypothetical protein
MALIYMIKMIRFVLRAKKTLRVRWEFEGMVQLNADGADLYDQNDPFCGKR